MIVAFLNSWLELSFHATITNENGRKKRIQVPTDALWAPRISNGGGVNVPGHFPKPVHKWPKMPVFREFARVQTDVVPNRFCL